MTYSAQVLYDMQPEIIRMSTPTPNPDYRNRIGKVNIVPPIIEFTNAQMVLQEGFNWLIYIYIYIQQSTL